MPLLGELGLLLVDVVLVEVELLTVVGCLGGGEKTDFELGGGGAKVERAGMEAVGRGGGGELVGSELRDFLRRVAGGRLCFTRVAGGRVRLDWRLFFSG